jgi:hypothetical protein
MNLFSMFSGIRGPVRAVVLYTQDDRTFRGLLVDRNREYVVLRAARLAQMNNQTGREEWTPLPGDVVIPAPNVAFWQEGLDPAVILAD